MVAAPVEMTDGQLQVQTQSLSSRLSVSPDDVLSSIYCMNERLAKITLYKDYLNEYASHPEKWNQLRLDVHQYGM